MRIDPAVKRILDEEGVSYKLVQKRDHLFAVFPNGERVIVDHRPASKCTVHYNMMANVKRAIRHARDSSAAARHA